MQVDQREDLLDPGKVDARQARPRLLSILLSKCPSEGSKLRNCAHRVGSGIAPFFCRGRCTCKSTTCFDKCFVYYAKWNQRQLAPVAAAARAGETPTVCWGHCQTGGPLKELAVSVAKEWHGMAWHGRAGHGSVWRAERRDRSPMQEKASIQVRTAFLGSKLRVQEDGERKAIP